MPTRLRDLHINRVALVDRGADQDADIVLWKRHAEGEGASDEVKTQEDSSVSKGDTMSANLDKVPEALRQHLAKADLSQDVVDALTQYLDTAQAAATDALQAKVNELTTELEAARATATSDDGDDVYKGMPEEVRKLLDTERAQREAVEKTLQAEIMKREIRDQIEVAKSRFGNIPDADPEKLGGVLYRMSKNTLTEEDRATLEQVLTAASTTIKANDLLKQELGNSGAAASTSDPLESIAKRLRAADEKLTQEQAMVKALETPEGQAAYAQYMREKNSRVLD